MPGVLREDGATMAGDPVILGSILGDEPVLLEKRADDLTERDAFVEKTLRCVPTTMCHKVLSDVLVCRLDVRRGRCVLGITGMSDLRMSRSAELHGSDPGCSKWMLAQPRSGTESNATMMSPRKDARHAVWPINVMKWPLRVRHMTRARFGYTIPDADSLQKGLRRGCDAHDAWAFARRPDRMSIAERQPVGNSGRDGPASRGHGPETEKRAGAQRRRLAASGPAEKTNFDRRSVVRTTPILRLLKGD